MFCPLEKCRINENAKRNDSNSRAKRNCMTATEGKNPFGRIQESFSILTGPSTVPQYRFFSHERTDIRFNEGLWDSG